MSEQFITATTIEKMKRTKRLRLSTGETFKYYEILFLIAAIALAFLFSIYFYKIDEKTSKIYWILALPAAAGIFYFILLYSKLSFRIMKTDIPKDRLSEILDQYASGSKRRLLQQTDGLWVYLADFHYEAKNKRITVLYDNGNILINSINDFGATKRNSFSFTRITNRRIENELMDFIKQCSK